MPSRAIELVSISHYTAPSHVAVTPWQIAPGVELIEILTGGQVFFAADGVERTFWRGTVFWHLPGEWTICRTPPDDPYRCIAIRFATPAPARPAGRVTQWASPEEAVEFAGEVLQEFHAGRLAPAVLSDYAYSTLAYRAALDRRPAGDRLPPALEYATSFLKTHSIRSVSVAEVAAHCGISRAHLFGLFRSYLGVTPHHFLLNFRLGAAKLRLSGSADPIKEIALECGFESLEVFYRRFRAAAGMTPGEYRRKHFFHLPR